MEKLHKEYSFSVIVAQEKDIPLISLLADRIWWETYRSILSPSQISYMLSAIYSYAALEKQMQMELQHFLIALENNVPVGYASWSMIKKTRFKLNKLYLLPCTQGRGYGKLLITTIENSVAQQGGNVLVLNVHKHNKALNFYQNMGFSIAKEEYIAIGKYFMNDYVVEKKLC